MKKILTLVSLIIALTLYGQITGIDLNRYPVVKFYFTADATITEIAEDGNAVDYSLSRNPKGFVSDLDLVFLIDQSGSMRDYINKIDALSNELTNTLSELDVNVRYALISFTDQINSLHRFTCDPSIFLDWVGSIIPFGGGDDNENSLQAIYEALNLNFDSRARKIFCLITNAPPHLTTNSSLTSQSINSIRNELNGKGIELVLCTPNHEAFLELASKTESSLYNIFALDGLMKTINYLKETFFKTYYVEYRTPYMDYNRQHSIKVKTVSGNEYTAEYLSPQWENSPPSISSISCLPPVLYSGESVTIAVEADDKDGDSLKYSWKLNGKLLENTSSSLTLTPESTGSYEAICAVSDGKTYTTGRTGFKVEDKAEPVIIEKKVEVEKVISEKTAETSDADLERLEKRFDVRVTASLSIDNRIVLGTSEIDGGQIIFVKDNEIEWSVSPGNSSVYWPGNNFKVDFIATGDIDDDNEREIIAVFNHVPWFPAMIVSLSFDGNINGIYYHPGHINNICIHDTNSDGIDEIIFTAVNSHLEQTSVFGVLDGRKLFGQAKPYNGYEVREAHELIYKEVEELDKITKIEFKVNEVILTDSNGQSIAFPVNW
ncbi:MAG: vWA domain-containing protein [Kosmotogaceae bacterium]